jgi:hypothetical protein
MPHKNTRWHSHPENGDRCWRVFFSAIQQKETVGGSSVDILNLLSKFKCGTIIKTVFQGKPEWQSGKIEDFMEKIRGT